MEVLNEENLHETLDFDKLYILINIMRHKRSANHSRSDLMISNRNLRMMNSYASLKKIQRRKVECQVLDKVSKLEKGIGQSLTRSQISLNAVE